MLWLSAIAGAMFLGAAVVFREDKILCYFLVAAGVLPAAVTCGLGVYFAVTKPDKLQSEDFQIRQQTLQLVNKGRFDAENVPIICSVVNPPPQLGHAPAPPEERR